MSEGKGAKAGSDSKDIWTLVKESKEKQDKEKKSKKEPHVIFVGPRGSGKSTLVKSCLSDQGEVTPTTALDYSFFRSTSGVTQEVTHLWELGGGRTLVKLLEIPLTPERMLSSTIVLVLDLSKPENVVSDAQYWMKAIRDQIATHVRFIQSKKLPHAQKLMDRAKGKFGANHPDISRVDLSIVPIMIVANKWDTFLAKYNNNPNQLRVMSHTLRAFAHQCGGLLSYCSSVQPHKNLLQSFRIKVLKNVTGRPDNTPNVTDDTRPILINVPGSDSYADIETAGSGSVLDGWMSACKNAFPADSTNLLADGDLPTLELLPEAVVDQMLTQRNEELLRKERERALERKLKSTEQQENPRGKAKGNRS